MVDMLFIRKGKAGRDCSVFGVEGADHKVATYSDGTDAREETADQLEEHIHC
jgi:hypothetical protein